MLQNAVILAVALLSMVLLFAPSMSGARWWRATITPLASIIGSGFLVLGPILDASYGKYAPLAMAALCLGGYAFGAAIRFNIAARAAAGGEGRRSRLAERVETVASWALAFAYVVSVAYYLNLFGAFAVSLTEVADPLHAKMVTTAALVLILVVGWRRGFTALEDLEFVSVTVKLAIIAGLLMGLAMFFLRAASGGALVFNPAENTGWAGLTLGFGLIVTVQGFETSRYLGDEYDPATRIRTMRYAQAIATAIYMVYIGLLSYVFARGDLALTETAIIDLMRVVAPVLPALLVAAALSAQFSAAVADTGGSGGLVAELTGGRITARRGYALLAAIGVLLTWTADVFEIIAYASRAFAFYYALQAAIAAVSAWRTGHRAKAPLFAALALLGLAIVLFGAPVEGAPSGGAS